jgi:hypothetical protein
MTEHGKQRSIFEPTGQELADAGMQQALDNANIDWKIEMHHCIEQLCSLLGVGATFTADDVNKMMEERPVTTHTKNAAGGIFRKKASEGFIVHVGYTKSTRPIAHAGVIGVWKILKTS